MSFPSNTTEYLLETALDVCLRYYNVIHVHPAVLSASWHEVSKQAVIKNAQIICTVIHHNEVHALRINAALFEFPSDYLG